MVVHIVYEVPCTYCGLSIRLHGATPGQRAYSPAMQTAPPALTVIGCPHCKHAAIHDHAYPLGMADTEPSIPLAYKTELWCNVANCGQFLPAIVATGEERYKEEIATWIYEDVACPNGHPFHSLKTGHIDEAGRK